MRWVGKRSWWVAAALGGVLAGFLLLCRVLPDGEERVPVAAPAPAGPVAPQPSREAGDASADAGQPAAPAAAAAGPATEDDARLRVECLPPVAREALPAELEAAAMAVAEAPEGLDRMAQCLTLRDGIAVHGVDLYARRQDPALGTVRDAVALCWQTWADRQPEDPLRREAVEQALGSALEPLEAGDWASLRAMTPELVAAEAPTDPYEDWDPPVDLPWVLAVRGEAPVSHFLALVTDGHPPSPRALSRLAMMGREDVLRALHEAGVPLGGTDLAGEDAVRGAVLSGDPGMLSLLAELGVELNRRSFSARPQYWSPAAERAPSDADALEQMLQTRPAMAAAAIRGGYAVRAGDLQAVIRHAPRDLADAVYRRLREAGCI